MRYFYNYLEDLCRKNVDISHSDTEKHYFRGELEEFYVDLRNKVSFPCVVTITQSAGDAYLNVAPTTLQMAADGTAVSFNIDSNTSWSIS